jgi:hypothetical protein
MKIKSFGRYPDHPNKSWDEVNKWQGITDDQTPEQPQAIVSNKQDPGEMEKYFRYISKIYDEGEDFPVDLDEVWPLAYTRKDNAVADLKKNFLQSVDYQVSLKNQGNPLGGRPTEEYKLSVSCLEYLIARKVPEVFKVYSEVFHRVRQQMQTPTAITADQIIAIGQRMKELEIKIELDAPKVELVDVATATDSVISMQIVAG